MTPTIGRGPVVIDTGVYGATLVPNSVLAAACGPIISGRSAFISFQTVAELRLGALLRGWGTARLQSLDARINQSVTVNPGPELVEAYAQLRATCIQGGHALEQRAHDADRWIAATALRLGVPLVSSDDIFAGVPSLRLETVSLAKTGRGAPHRGAGPVTAGVRT